MKPGAWCHCLGEGGSVFTVEQVFDVYASANLLTEAGRPHGMESFSKLYRSMEELEARRPELKNKTPA